MLPYPDPSTLDPEMSFSPSQEVISPPTLNPYYYPMSSPPFSPSNFNYDFLFTATDALPGDALDASALPPPDPEAGREGATVAAPPATRKTGRRKRFRTDRHSKIHTSQGLRDRRMRLSLNVARQFFRLQDMLGFDKASHTIDWLLTQSKSAIELLAGSSRFSNKNNQLNSGGGSFVAESSASECEVVSSNSNHKPKPTAAASSKAKGTTTPRPSREVAFDPPIFTRESRDKARARARERTIEKKRIRSERPASDHTRLVDQLVTSKITNGEEEGVRVSDQVYGCSQMSMISPWFMYDNNEANELLDEQHKISFSGNKEEEGIFLG